jgi:uncharacterized protein YegP (UPF0339 family)
VLKKGSTGKFRFNLIATNGQVTATSEAYESKASAIKGIESVSATPRQVAFPVLDVWEVTLWGLLAGFLLGVATELVLVAAGG